MSKRKSQREMAERSITRFARSSASSTPIGYTFEGADNSDETQQWPGPLATASAMIAERDEVKRLRLEAISHNQEGIISDVDENADQYDLKLIELSKKNGDLATGTEEKFTVDIPSLSDLCINFISANFESVTSLGDLSSDLLENISYGLAKYRKLSPEVVLILATPGSTSLVLSDCASISESDMIQALEKVTLTILNESTDAIQKSKKSGRNKKEAEDMPIKYSGCLKTLKLKNCGHGFGDRAALTLAHMGNPSTGPGLETLVITGCYRLADQCLGQLLEKCSSTLLHLDLSCNSRLGAVGIKAICKYMSCLRHLKLAFCTQLNDADVLILCGENNVAPLPVLETLDLSGLLRITDDAVERLLIVHGKKISGLHLGDCTALTDKTLAVVLQFCGNLQTLDLSRLPLVSEQGLSQLLLPEVAVGALVRIGLGGLPVTNEMVLGLCRSVSTTLEDLDLSGCSALSAKALVMLMTHCLRLRSLDLSFVRTFPDIILRALIDACPHIRRVRVWGCSQLTTRIHDVLTRPNLVVQGLSSALCSD